MSVYEPIENELSIEVALVQAAHVLDVAVSIAIDAKDSEQLQSLALLWMELAKFMVGEPDEDDEEEDSSAEQVRVVGFSHKETERIVE